VVEDSVWMASGLGTYDGCLCIPCLELRLGRQLTYSDFCRCEPMPPISPDDPGVTEDQLAVWCRANAQRLKWRGWSRMIPRCWTEMGRQTTE
jgi:hypothetical protein